MLLSGSAAADQRYTPANEDFQVNTYTTGNSVVWSAAATSDGGFVAVLENHADGFEFVWFDAAGAFVRSVPIVSPPGHVPDLALSPADDIAVVWTTAGPEQALQLYDALGAPLAPSFEINTYTTGNQGGGRIAAMADRFLVVWGSEADGSQTSVAGRVLDWSGTPLSSEFVVNTYTTDHQYGAEVAAHDDGFVVVWTSRVDGDPVGVLGQRLAADGTPVGTEFQVGPPGSGLPAVAAKPDGSFLVAWSYSPIGDSSLRARWYDDAGAPVGSEFDVTGHEATDARVLAPAGDPGFVVVWYEFYGPHDQTGGIEARAFDAPGVPAAGELLVNSYVSSQIPGTSGAPHRAVATPQGNVFVVWKEDIAFGLPPFQDPRDGDLGGVFGRKLCSTNDPGCDICAGHDDAIDDDADGIPNGCDACTNVGAAQSFTEKTRLDLYYKSAPPLYNPDARFAFTSTVVVPGGFAALDPASTGVRLRVETSTGGVMLDSSLPGGTYAGKGTRGWTTKNGKLYLFKDGTDDAIGGFRTVQLKDDSAHGADRVSVRIKGRKGFYLSFPEYAAPRLTVSFGEGGFCAESSFQALDCTYSLIDRIYDTKYRQRCSQ